VVHTTAARRVGVSPLGPPLLSRVLADLLDRRDDVADAVALLRDAGNPYCDWFFGGPDHARVALARALERPSSEFAADRVNLLLARDRLAGVSLALGGDELARCRRADTVAAIVDAGTGRAALAGRIAETQALFLPVAEDSLYVSRLAVAPGLRGLGLGRLLLDDRLATGRSEGFTRFALDVAADNESAVGLYRSVGFRVEAARQAAGMRYLRMTLVEDTRV
jgi:ribosomal protein S18 acetylase RimI-like enzyme